MTELRKEPERIIERVAAAETIDITRWGKPIATIELAHNEDIDPPPGFEAVDERRYGAAKIVILRKIP